jgi:hypothetical protein
MKKLLFFSLILFAAYAVKAQDYTVNSLGAPIQIVTNDTITDTGYDDVTVLLKPPAGYVYNVTVQVIGAPVSGTHHINLDYYQSLDGTNWELISSGTDLSSGNLVELFTDVNGYYGRYFKLLYTGGASQVTKINAYLYVLPYKQ